MTDERSIKYAKEIMRLYGIEIQPIQRSSQKTPDFEFTCATEHYVVEMKERLAEWDLSTEEKVAFEAGHVIHKAEGIGYHPTLASNIKKGGRQIDAYASSKSSFRLIWYFALGQRSYLAAQRILTTLLGDIPVYELGSERQWIAYFYNDNLFNKLGNKIDGAFVVREDGDGVFNIKFVLNPYSARYAALQQSRLASLYSEGVLDPLALEATGDALIVDAAADRSSERATLNYIGNKYKINVPQTIHMGHVEARCRADIEQEY